MPRKDSATCWILIFKEIRASPFKDTLFLEENKFQNEMGPSISNIFTGAPIKKQKLERMPQMDSVKDELSVSR